MSRTSLARIADLFRTARRRVIIISAFMSAEALRQLLQASPSVQRTVYVRWRMQDIVSRATDAGIYEVAKDSAASLKFHQRLHAKAYISDDCALVGSANATFPGLGISRQNNIELLTETTTRNADITQLLAILESESADAAQIPVNIQEGLTDSLRASMLEDTEGQVWIPSAKYDDVQNLVFHGVWNDAASADCIALGISFGSSRKYINEAANESMIFLKLADHMRYTTVGVDKAGLVNFLSGADILGRMPTDSELGKLVDWIRICAKDMTVVDHTTSNPKILPLSRM